MWMLHPETGNYADLPDLPYWRARGWQPTAGPPPEPDLLHDPLPDVDDPQIEPRPEPYYPGEHNPDPGDTSGSSAAQTVKSADPAATEESDSDR